MSELRLEAEPRTLVGRKVRQLRTQGWVPVVVYGQAQPPTNLQVTSANLERVLHHGGMSQLVQVQVHNGGAQNILVREVQRHPVSHHLMHADFYAVNMSEMQQVHVPIVAVGRPSALSAGLMMLQPMDSVEIEALPADIPAFIEVDVSGLTDEEPLTVAHLPAVNGVTYLAHAEDAVFTLIATRAAEADEEAEAEMVEPEVISRGREEEED